MENVTETTNVVFFWKIRVLHFINKKYIAWALGQPSFHLERIKSNSQMCAGEND